MSFRQDSILVRLHRCRFSSWSTPFGRPRSQRVHQRVVEVSPKPEFCLILRNSAFCHSLAIEMWSTELGTAIHRSRLRACLPACPCDDASPREGDARDVPAAADHFSISKQWRRSERESGGLLRFVPPVLNIEERMGLGQLEPAP